VYNQWYDISCATLYYINYKYFAFLLFIPYPTIMNVCTWIWRLPMSGMWCFVLWQKCTSTTQKSTASIFMVEDNIRHQNTVPLSIVNINKNSFILSKHAQTLHSSLTIYNSGSSPFKAPAPESTRGSTHV